MHPFSINLVGCRIENTDFKDLNQGKFKVSFDGLHDGEFFGV